MLQRPPSMYDVAAGFSAQSMLGSISWAFEQSGAGILDWLSFCPRQLLTSCPHDPFIQKEPNPP